MSCDSLLQLTLSGSCHSNLAPDAHVEEEYYEDGPRHYYGEARRPGPKVGNPPRQY